MNESEHERPILTVDIVLLTLHENRLHVALQRRDKPPAEGVLTLVGGYVHVDKDANTLATAQRVLRSKVGLDGIFCEQLMTFSGPTRDSRGWSATVAYYALAPEKVYREATTGEFVLMPADAPGDLPFDHKAIVAAALERLRVKGAYSTLPALLLPPSFTLLQLRSIYEQVMGVSLNDSPPQDRGIAVRRADRGRQEQAVGTASQALPLAAGDAARIRSQDLTRGSACVVACV